MKMYDALGGRRLGAGGLLLAAFQPIKDPLYGVESIRSHKHRIPSHTIASCEKRSGQETKRPRAISSGGSGDRGCHGAQDSIFWYHISRRK